VFPASQLQARQRTNLAQGQPTVDRQDRTHLIVKVQPLSPEDYVFEWRVLSRDGHSARGKINFRVRAPNESAMQSGKPICRSRRKEARVPEIFK
jgi:methionine-rich copper-binding protein CopC